MRSILSEMKNSSGVDSLLIKQQGCARFGWAWIPVLWKSSTSPRSLNRPSLHVGAVTIIFRNEGDLKTPISDYKPVTPRPGSIVVSNPLQAKLLWSGFTGYGIWYSFAQKCASSGSDSFKFNGLNEVSIPTESFTVMVISCNSNPLYYP